MAEKLENKQKEAPKKKRLKKQEFKVLRTIRLGSNKDGSAKESYTQGQTIELSSKTKIKKLKHLKVI